MSNEPRWLLQIDRKIGKASIEFDTLLRDYRQALERVHELEAENAQLRASLKRLGHTEIPTTLPEMNWSEPQVSYAGPALSPLALPRSEKPRRAKKSEVKE